MIYVESYDGVKIGVHLWNAQSRKAVVLLHGWPFSYQIFESQIGILVRKGYMAVAPDMRGFGASGIPETGYGYDSLAADLRAVLVRLKIKNCTLAAFGMGGGTALRYMKNYNGKDVGKLLLLSAAAPGMVRSGDTVYGHDKDEMDRLLHFALTDRPKLAEEISLRLFACPKSSAFTNWFCTMALSASGIATVNTAVTLRDESVMEDLRCVRIPTTIIHGGKDDIVTPDMAAVQHREIVTNFPGLLKGSSGMMEKKVRRYCLKNSGHGILWDELENFNCLFLREVIQ